MTGVQTCALPISIVSNGTLTLGNRIAIGSGTLTNNAIVNVASGITEVVIQGLAGAGTLSLSNLSGVPQAVLANIGGNDASTTYSGTITGAGNLVKEGAGRLTLSGPNTYTGGTTITAGVIQAASNTALGDIAGNITVQSGASLELANVVIGAQSITLNGGGVNDGGAMRAVSGTNSYSGAITLNANSRINVRSEEHHV